MVNMAYPIPKRKPNPNKATLNPVLREFWLTPARERVLYGGRASSKSWDAAGFAIYLARSYKLRIMCVRQFQNKIEDSVYSLLKDQIERFGLMHEFKILKTKIVHRYTGTEFLFYGLWRHITEIKSTEGVDICWMEEAHALTEAQWEILEPTLRNEDSQFWIIFNPKLVSDFVYKRFVRGNAEHAHSWRSLWHLWRDHQTEDQLDGKSLPVEDHPESDLQKEGG